jgi:hypothetical protein
MNINAMFKECMKPHALVHYIAGAGIAFILLYFILSLTTNILVFGIILFAVAFILEFFVNPARKQ